MLYVHLSDAAITNARLGELGRLENTRSLITAEQVRAWCANPDTQLIVNPVIDLHAHVHVAQYEVPDRMAEAAALIDVTCVFPFCTRPARGCRAGEHDADCDHITPYGPYATGRPARCNLAPLCRRHHRLKTHGGWRYVPRRARDLSVDVAARADVPAGPRGHPRRDPRPPHPRLRAPTRLLNVSPRTPPADGGGLGMLTREVRG